MQSIAETNSQRLAQNGWTVDAEAHDDLPTDAIASDYRIASEQTIEEWLAWLPTCGAQGALLTCVHLADALLVGGQAKQLVAAARSFGDLTCGAMVRRVDEYIALRYTLGLLQGRRQPLQERELAARGINNYLARLAKWQEAAESDFTLTLARTDRPEDGAVVRLLGTLGVPALDDLELPEPSRADRLDSLGAEVLRRFNRLLDAGEPNHSRAAAMRNAAVVQLTADAPVRAFRIPADAAGALLRTFEQPARELARAMSADDRAHYLSLDIPNDERLDDSEVSGRLMELADDLGVKTDTRGSSTQESVPHRRVRRMALRAQVAQREGDLDVYQRSTRQMRNAIPTLVHFEPMV